MQMRRVPIGRLPERPDGDLTATKALADYGFRAIIASSFADILLRQLLSERAAAGDTARGDGGWTLSALRRYRALRADHRSGAASVTDHHGFHAGFTMDEYGREMLLRGLDEIGRTLLDEERIARFEQRRRALSPAS